ncbi:MAG: DUF2283 domain-containing protein [Deltaproteobacteria bacterium]|nr:DUF2283 domain-containing protein [Deltaproteobacteria bacterium]MBI4224642.1 DUF2283 domain-containing protein [Deltaproteobacteria bacterium]
MKLNYYRDTDSLYIELSPKKSVETREIAQGLLVDFDKSGNVVGIDIDHAKSKLDLTRLETVSLPITASRMAG